MRSNKVTNHLSRLFYMAFFAGVFVVLGAVLPDAYYKYFDKTEYYTIESPALVVGTKFKKCETVTVLLDRTSLVNTEGDALVDLVLVETDAKQRIIRKHEHLVITKGKDRWKVSFELGCDVPPGNYYLEGIVSYEVRGILKYTAFITTNFEVCESEVIEIIND